MTYIFIYDPFLKIIFHDQFYNRHVFSMGNRAKKSVKAKWDTLELIYFTAIFKNVYKYLTLENYGRKSSEMPDINSVYHFDLILVSWIRNHYPVDAELAPIALHLTGPCQGIYVIQKYFSNPFLAYSPSILLNTEEWIMFQTISFVCLLTLKPLYHINTQK